MLSQAGSSKRSSRNYAATFLPIITEDDYQDLDPSAESHTQDNTGHQSVSSFRSSQLLQPSPYPNHPAHAASRDTLYVPGTLAIASLAYPRTRTLDPQDGMQPSEYWGPPVTWPVSTPALTDTLVNPVDPSCGHTILSPHGTFQRTQAAWQPNLAPHTTAVTSPGVIRLGVAMAACAKTVDAQRVNDIILEWAISERTKLLRESSSTVQQKKETAISVWTAESQYYLTCARTQVSEAIQGMGFVPASQTPNGQSRDWKAVTSHFGKIGKKLLRKVEILDESKVGHAHAYLVAHHFKVISNDASQQAASAQSSSANLWSGLEM